MTASPWQYFSMEELTCHCGCGQMKMDPKFMAVIVQLRQELGFPFPVTSAYRSPEYNAKISDSGLDGPHTKGVAMDIAVRGEQAHRLLKAALDAGMRGIGVQQRGGSRFLHLDMLAGDDQHPRPWVWSYK